MTLPRVGVMITYVLQALLLGGGTGCAAQAASIPNLAVPLSDPAGQLHLLSKEVSQAPLTVLVFVSPDCPVVKAHSPRLALLAQRYQAQGVRFLSISNEQGPPVVGRNGSIAPGEPLLFDRDHRLTEAVGVESSGEAVVLDRSGRIRYQGGLDSDRVTLHPTAQPWLEEALEALLKGKEVPRPRTRAFGCFLRR